MEKFTQKKINDEDGTTNCWACTLAGLANITVTRLKQMLGTMDIEDDDSRTLEIFYNYAQKLHLTKEKEVNCDSVMIAYNLGNSFNQNDGKFALLMSRKNAPGHIIAAYKINGQLYYADYQTSDQLIPIDFRVLGAWQAEYSRCKIIQFREIDLFTLSFSSLSLQSGKEHKDNS